MFKKFFLKKCISAGPSVLCVWCGNEVPCVGHMPTKCPFCGHSL